MGIRPALIALMADGGVHSGADLARQLGCSRTAVWKHLHELRAVGLEIEARRGRGYRLARPLDPLDANAIRAALDMPARSALGRLEVHGVIDSTSAWLGGLPTPAPGRFDAVLAEHQTEGRGRRGRRWLSPFGGGLCLSLNRRLDTVPAALSALSLAAGVAVCRALQDAGGAGAGLKWPNDIVVGDGKLGGLLVDVAGEADGPISIVIGIGLNLSVPPAMAARVVADGGLRPTGLRELSAGAHGSRNRLAARLISAMHAALSEFEQRGFAGFVDDWRRYDVLADRPVVVHVGSRTLSGTARGIDADGRLVLEAAGGTQRLVSGEVSLRFGDTGNL